MWRVIKWASRSAVLLDGEKSASLNFSVEQGVAQGVVYPQFYFQCLSMIS